MTDICEKKREEAQTPAAGRVGKACGYLEKLIPARPELGLILGSGLGDLAQRLDNPTAIPYGDIPGFPVSTVEGHGGNLLFGWFRGKYVAVMQGRAHYYEGYSQQEITLPVRVLAKLGIRTLLVTNAAGGVNLDFSVGTLMLISDHINFSGSNPLVGPNPDPDAPRFPDMSDVYTRTLRDKLKPLAAQAGLDLKEGVYVMFSGPSYETPAEVCFARTMGGDAVGMSTVPEAIVARHCGLQVMGVSCITNMAAGIIPQRQLSHQEVMEATLKVKARITKLLELMVDVA